LKRLLFDTESDGLVDNATQIHCTAAEDVDTGEQLDWRPGQLAQTVEVLDKADVLIGHNIQRHDIPLITKLTGWKPRAGVVIRDTMVCARVIYPNVKETDGALIRANKMPAGKGYQGKHTLGAWGYRLGTHKGDYAKVKEAEALAKGIDDPDAILRYVWGVWNEEMHAYMLQDRGTNLALWKHLRVDNYSQLAIDLEHRIARIVDAMEHAGVPFDVEAAGRLQAHLVTERDKVSRELIERFGSWYQPVSPDAKRATFTPKKDSARHGYTAGAPMTKLKLVTFNPGSRDHIARVLLAKGWKPEKMTEGGKPQIDEETVSGIVAAYPDFAGLGDYLLLEKRISQLAGGKSALLQMVKKNGRIHGVINPMGTGTGRASHFNPNLAQVPNVASKYGKEFRSCVYAPPGWIMIGADMAGLELRCLAHYLHPLDGGKYAIVVLEGDPHWAHACAMGLAGGDRDKVKLLHTIIREDGSKRFIYAYIYGCGNGKAGEIIFTCLDKARLQCAEDGEELFKKFFPDGYSDAALARVGARVRNSFAKRIDGFTKLKEKIEQQVEDFGWVPGLDGRRIPTRSAHSALNFMLQSAGAILCKRWLADAFEAVTSKYKHGWDGDVVFGLWVHDEIQVWVREGLEEEIKAIIVACAQKAGEPYGFRLRVDGDAKVGRNWAETH
jgi:DNA polymerase-1